MHSPEAIGLKQKEQAQTLETSLPDVTVRDLEAADLIDLKALFDKNDNYFVQGGIYADGLYSMIERELTDKPLDGVHRMGIWRGDVLAGFASVVPYEDAKSSNEVEVAYAVGQDYAHQGVATAAIDAVVEREVAEGNTVVAEVEQYNPRSMRLLGKLGFELDRRRHVQGREVFVRKVLTTDEMMRRLGM